MGRVSLVLLLFISTSACGSLQRSRTSGYASEYEVSNYETSESRYESDERPSRSLASVEREGFEERYRLKQLENSLNGVSERRQYFRIKPMLTNDRERIEFLALKDMRARERFLQNKGVTEATGALEKSVQTAVDEGDIMLGMPKEAVESSWGHPDQREIAGNTRLENERWIYSSYIPAPEGYKKEIRTVYFESGRVVGWTQD